MRAILINVNEQSVSEVEVDEHDSLASIYSHLGCDLFDVIHVEAGRPHSLFVDDEGLLKNPDKFFCIPALYGGWLAGNGLLLGFDRNSGDSRPCTLSVEGVRQLVHFVEVQEEVCV